MRLFSGKKTRAANRTWTAYIFCQLWTQHGRVGASRGLDDAFLISKRRGFHGHLSSPTEACHSNHLGSLRGLHVTHGSGKLREDGLVPIPHRLEPRFQLAPVLFCIDKNIRVYTADVLRICVITCELAYCGMNMKDIAPKRRNNKVRRKNESDDKIEYSGAKELYSYGCCSFENAEGQERDRYITPSYMKQVKGSKGSHGEV